MNADKTQKRHPSVYGIWQVIGEPSSEEMTESYDDPPLPQDNREEGDDDLKELDRILAEEDGEQQQQSTYESDDSLEALDSVIKDLKKKSKVPEKILPQAPESPQSGLDIQYLLDQEEPVDLTELERQLFGGGIPEEHETGSREPTLDEIEYTYLENLEKQYQQQKHASESGSHDLDVIRKLMDGWDEQNDGGETDRHKQNAAKQRKDS